jgi:predicted phosphodiesterase
MTKIEIATQYSEKYLEIAIRDNKQFSKRWIASIIFAENPTIFKDEEDARYFVRIVTGANGNEKRKGVKHTDLASRFALMPPPLTDTRNISPFITPTSIKKTLVLADIHGRFYNREAFEIAIETGVKRGCDSVIVDGDFMDFYQFSKFDKNPAISIIFEEQEWGQDVLRMLQDAFGTVILKEGNHDMRREKYIARLAATMPELMNMSSYSDYLFFDGCHVNFVEDYNHIEYGKLSIIHGHEYYGGGGIHVAYNRFNKALDNLMSAHSHIAQSVIKKDIHDHIMGSWTLGCICNLNPRYSPKNNWNNGFGIIEKDSSGDFEVDNRVVYGKKTFSV